MSSSGSRSGITCATVSTIFPRMLIVRLVHAAIAFSTISKGAIVTIDTSAAEQAPGVLSVITHLNAPEMKVSPEFSIGDDPSSGSTLVKILNTDRISWNGQPVAVVVADTPEQAEYAASLIHVTYARNTARGSYGGTAPVKEGKGR